MESAPWMLHSDIGERAVIETILNVPQAVAMGVVNARHVFHVCNRTGYPPVAVTNDCHTFKRTPDLCDLVLDISHGLQFGGHSNESEKTVLMDNQRNQGPLAKLDEIHYPGTVFHWRQFGELYLKTR